MGNDGAHTHYASFNRFAYQLLPGEWVTNIKGTYHVTAPSDHLEIKLDGTAWTQIVRRTSPDSVSFNWHFRPPPGELRTDTVGMQTCHEHWYGDDCYRVYGS